MKTDTESNKLPAHYGSARQLVGKLVGGYLKSIDAAIRLLGASIICAILHWAVWVALNAISNLVFGEMFSEGFVLLLMFLMSPVIIRVGLLGGGFLIPPIFNSSAKQTNKNKPNKAEMATPRKPSD